MVRRWSKSASLPRLPIAVPSFGDGQLPVSSSPQSVHFAGMSERLPSGRLTSRSNTPRRRMLLMTAKVRPSKAWRSRMIVTAAGI
jgi:hypothetical protein